MTPTRFRLARRFRLPLLTLGLMAVVLCFGIGCGAVRHLHPGTGNAYEAVFKVQRRTKGRRAQMSGEDGEIVMENLAKSSKTTDLKQNKANFLLPLQR